MDANVELLKKVSSRPFEECEGEWRQLLNVLRLSLSFVLPIQKVLEQGRWKDQPNPMAYIKKAGVRVAVRMGLVDLGPRDEREVLACELNDRDLDGEPLEHDDKLGMALNDFQEKYGRPEFYSSVADDLPEEVLDGEDVDWDWVAELAGLDTGEKLVMDLRVVGFSQAQAYEACLTEEDRKYLQASWRRFDRRRGLLKEALETAEARKPRRTKRIEPEMELIFIEMPEGHLKISFRKHVRENGKLRI